MTSTVALKRGYEPADPLDGTRVLVDRLWLRGVSKEQAHLDAWMKDLGPSTELRKWFGHRAERWEAFRCRYREELMDPGQQTHLALLRSAAAGAPLTLVYGAADTERNAAVVVRDWLIGNAPDQPADLRQAARVATRAVSAAHAGGEVMAEIVMPFLAGLGTREEIAEALAGLQHGKAGSE